MQLNELQNKMAEMEKALSGESLNLWKLIKIEPVKWNAPQGEAWVVALIGQKLVWFNGPENRFVFSVYHQQGTIAANADKIGQSDVPDNMLSLLTALRAIGPR